MGRHHHAARQAVQEAKKRQYMHRLPPAEMFTNRKKGERTPAEKAALGVAYLVVASVVLFAAVIILGLAF